MPSVSTAGTQVAAAKVSGLRKVSGPRALQCLYVAVFVGFLLAPLIVVIGASFDPRALLRFPPHGISPRWYVAALHSPFMSAARLSLTVAILATVSALVLGVPAAWALARFEFPAKTFVNSLLSAPLLVPQLVIGVTLLQIFAGLHLGASVITLALAHILITLPYVIRIIHASILGVDVSIEEAASNLGANRLRVYLTIVLPIIRPALYSAALFAFLVSFDDAVVALFLVSGATTTLPIAIYTYVQYDLDPTIAAISSMLIVVSVALMYVARKLAPIDRLT